MKIGIFGIKMASIIGSIISAYTYLAWGLYIKFQYVFVNPFISYLNTHFDFNMKSTTINASMIPTDGLAEIGLAIMFAIFYAGIIVFAGILAIEVFIIACESFDYYPKTYYMFVKEQYKKICIEEKKCKEIEFKNIKTQSTKEVMMKVNK